MQVSMGKESRTTDMERIEKMTEHTIEHAIEYTSKDEGLIGNEKIEEAIAALQQQISELHQKNAEAEARRQAYETSLEGVLNSSSWRLTRPLRSLLGLFRH